MDEYYEFKTKSGSLYGKTVESLMGLTDWYPVVPSKQYLDASVCTNYFDFRAECAFALYKQTKYPKIKAKWLKKYCYYKRLVNIFSGNGRYEVWVSPFERSC